VGFSARNPPHTVGNVDREIIGRAGADLFCSALRRAVTVIAGLAGGLSLGTVLSISVILAMTSLFLGLGGMWLSTLLESRTRGVGLIGALGLYEFIVGVYGFRDTGLPGLAAFSPLTVMHYLPGGRNSPWHRSLPVLFGHEVAWLLMCVLLCGSFSAWLALMLVRNLKRSYQEIRPLSRWQAVACAAFLNFLMFAILRPALDSASLSGALSDGPPSWFTSAKAVAAFAVGMNGLILFLMGLATLTPQERLKIWRRNRATRQRLCSPTRPVLALADNLEDRSLCLDGLGLADLEQRPSHGQGHAAKGGGAVALGARVRHPRCSASAVVHAYALAATGGEGFLYLCLY
jgi:hypothetical protein